MQDVVIGVDLGGTKIACAAVDNAGQVLEQVTLPTNAAEGADAVIGRIVNGIDALRPVGRVRGIGIGCPGPVVEGVAKHAVNLGWHDVPLAAQVASKTGLSTRAENDIKALAQGERTFGAARGVDDFVYLAVGTGLGGAAVMGGRLLVGATGWSMEVGHISLDYGDPNAPRQCGCGGRNCAEMYISGKGLLTGYDVRDAATTQHLERTTGAILNAARNGDPVALAITSEASEALSIVMGWCAGLLSPALFVIGGGLGHAGYDLLVEPAIQRMNRYLTPDIQGAAQVVRSQIENSAVGAAALAWAALRG